MPLQNRVQPNGDIISAPARGMFMGNRGILHNDSRQIGTARWKHKAWVCCVLAFKNRQRTLMAPHNYTELFFLDEAVSLAAGHRPCAECRRADYTRFVDAWERATCTRPKAPHMDAVLHPARVRRDRTTVRHDALIATLPFGTMIMHDGTPHLLTDTRMHPYAPTGYGPATPRPRSGNMTVLTPAPTVAVLAHGYIPLLHPTAI